MSRITDGSVQGRCPACGHEVLILGAGGYVTCSLIGCPDPEAATKMLERKNEIMVPTVGRTVHYVSHGTPVQSDGSQAYTSQCRAAIITGAVPLPQAVGTARQAEDGYAVDMTVFNPDGWFCNHSVPYDQWDSTEALPGAQAQPGSWHWPERAQ